MEKEGKKSEEKKFYGHPRFYEILNELAELHSRKNYQYATQNDPLANFKRTGNLAGKLFKDGINKPLGMALMYMSKQIDGVYEMVGEAKKNTEEELEDKLRDIAVYAIISIILNDENKPKVDVIEPKVKYVEED